MPQANPLAQIDQLQRLDLQNQALQQGQATLGLQRVNAVNNMLGTLITKPDLSVSDVTNQLDTMVRNKIISPNEPAAIMQHLQPFANDPEGLRGALKNSYLQSLDHASKMQMGFGQQTVYDNGVARRYGVTNVMDPGRPQFAGGTVQPNFSPMNVPNASSGATDIVPAAKFGQDIGAFNGAVTRGRPQQPQPGAAPGGGSAQPGYGAVPGVPPQLGVDREAYNQDLAASKNLMTSIQPLKQALPLAERLITGPGTKTINDVRSFLITQGVIKPDQKVDERHELDKYLAQTVAASPLASRSDMGTIVSQASNPNTVSQTTPATIALIRNAIAQANLQAASPYAFQGKPDSAGGTSPLGYQQHRGAFIQQQDVDAYKLDTMHTDDARALVQKYAAMDRSDPRRVRFFNSLTNADKAKVISAPGQ